MLNAKIAACHGPGAVAADVPLIDAELRSDRTPGRIRKLVPWRNGTAWPQSIAPGSELTRLGRLTNPPHAYRLICGQDRAGDREAWILDSETLLEILEFRERGLVLLVVDELVKFV